MIRQWGDEWTHEFKNKLDVSTWSYFLCVCLYECGFKNLVLVESERVNEWMGFELLLETNV